MKKYVEIPTLDLNDFNKGTFGQKMKFVQDLGEAYENIGFAAITNHGLSSELQEKLYESSKEFFESKEEEKLECYDPTYLGQRGYTPRNKEKAKGSSTSDMKEFFQLGHDNVEKNIFPTKHPKFEESTKEAFNTLENTGKTILKAIAFPNPK